MENGTYLERLPLRAVRRGGGGGGDDGDGDLGR